ncbi:MAG TPA: pyridoxamine 5'-phosphate oxidase family protein [Candidatus Limnocylindrales bacterium]|jgi:predicted pyridoxine 5'-phosphate oxidase superfamily flavin-nucleotide-binding protein
MPADPPTLTPTQRAFLQRPLAVSVASVDTTGTPSQAVAWYDLTADDRVLLNSNTGRRWCTNLMTDPRVALSVIDPDDPYSWLGIAGIVDEVITDVARSREDIIALAHRYHPKNGPTESSIATFRGQPRVTFLVRITGIHDHLED